MAAASFDASPTRSTYHTTTGAKHTAHRLRTDRGSFGRAIGAGRADPFSISSPGSIGLSAKAGKGRDWEIVDEKPEAWQDLGLYLDGLFGGNCCLRRQPWLPWSSI